MGVRIDGTFEKFKFYYDIRCSGFTENKVNKKYTSSENDFQVVVPGLAEY